MDKEICEFASKDDSYHARMSPNGYACSVMYECRYGPEKEKAVTRCPRYVIGKNRECKNEFKVCKKK